jgi:hypothetical protein
VNKPAFEKCSEGQIAPILLSLRPSLNRKIGLGLQLTMQDHTVNPDSSWSMRRSCRPDVLLFGLLHVVWLGSFGFDRCNHKAIGPEAPDNYPGVAAICSGHSSQRWFSHEVPSIRTTRIACCLPLFSLPGPRVWSMSDLARSRPRPGNLEPLCL